MTAHAPAAATSSGSRSKILGPDGSIRPRTVSGAYVFDFAVNDRVVQQHPRADATNNVTDTDVGMIATDCIGASQTFNAIRYPSYSESADGTITTGAYSAVIAAKTWLQIMQSLSPTSLWRLGEPSGTTCTDAQSAHSGTYVGAPTLAVTGPLTTDTTTAATFVTGTSYATILASPSSGILRGQTNWWVHFNIKHATTGGLNVYTERDTSTGKDILRCEMNQGRVQLEYRDDANTLQSVITPITELYNDGAFHSVVITKQDTAVSIYVDGVLKKTGTLSATAQTNTSVGVAIGHDPTGDSGTDTFSLANVAIGTTVPSAASIATLAYAVGNPSGTANTISVRTEFRQMSRRVVRKRIFVSQSSGAYTASMRLCDGFVGSTTSLSVVSWDDVYPGSGSNLGASLYTSSSIVGWVLNTASAEGRAGWGIGIPDAYLNRRQMGATTENALTASSNLMCALVGNNSGSPVYTLSTTETHVDVFYWAAYWSDTDSRRRQLSMCLADAQGVDQDLDDVVRLAAVCARSCKSAAAPGSTTPACHDAPGASYSFPRGDAFAILGMNDHAYAAAEIQRGAALMSVNGVVSAGSSQTATGVIPDSFNDDGTVRVFNYSGDSNALVLLISYWLKSHAIDSVNSETINGLTGAQIASIVDFLIAQDDGSGFPTFTIGGFNLHPGHYDWYSFPSGWTHYTSAMLAGYYACALIASKRLGYAPSGIDTKIANATAAYQSFYSSSLGHLRFAKNTVTGDYLNYGSLLDLLPEWWAVNVLDTELLGSTIVSNSVSYFLNHQTVRMTNGSLPAGQAMRLFMGDGGTTYVGEQARFTADADGSTAVLRNVSSFTGLATGQYVVGYSANGPVQGIVTISSMDTTARTVTLSGATLTAGTTLDFIASNSESGGIEPGTYVNGGSQMLFDFTTAALGQYYGVAGCKEFWADRKIAEVNREFAIHEAFTTVSPSPDPTSNPYNGRNSRTFPWNGVIAGYEAVSELA